MAFEKIVPRWEAAGTEPPEDFKKSGFAGGYRPPAAFFNWFWTGVSEALTELQGGAMDKKAAVIDANADLDNYTTLGIYTYSASTSAYIAHAPAGEQCTIIVLPRLTEDDPANRVQIAVAQSNKLYIRNRSDGVWGNWVGIDMSSGGGRLVPGTCTQISDWNNANLTGWYMGNNAANAPTNDNSDALWYFGYVIAHSGNYVLQEAYQFAASGNAVEIPKYIRVCKDGTWGAWTEVTVKSVVPGDLQGKLDAKMASSPKYIEFKTTSADANGGYLDFKYGGSSEDYTARIIEDQQGRINVVGTLFEDGKRVYSAANKPSASDIGAAASGHNHSASDITSGTLAKERLATSGVSAGSYGPTGAVTSGSFNVPQVSVDTYGRVTSVTNRSVTLPSAVDSIAASKVTAGTLGGKVQANASAAATVGNAQVRDIVASTTDLTAGTSSLTSGQVYLFYE